LYEDAIVEIAMEVQSWTLRAVWQWWALEVALFAVQLTLPVSIEIRLNSNT
jgi:hypothetical protein